jgi:hypothetical protein
METPGPSVTPAFFIGFEKLKGKKQDLTPMPEMKKKPGH